MFSKFKIFNNMNKQILIVCMPKTGSTYILKKLIHYTNFERIVVRAQPEIQEFDEKVIRKSIFKNLVDQIHVQGSNFAVKQINTLNNPKVIILYRKLSEIIFSFRDFSHSEEMRKNFDKKGYVSIFGSIFDKNYYSLDKNDQLNFIIKYSVPQLIYFYVSWEKFSKQIKTKVKWLDYDKFFKDYKNEFIELIKFCELDVNKNLIETTLGFKHNTRFNESKNINERNLNDDQKNEIIKLLKFYPNLKQKLF